MTITYYRIEARIEDGESVVYNAHGNECVNSEGYIYTLRETIRTFPNAEVVEEPYLYGKIVHGIRWIHYLVEASSMSEACRKVKVLIAAGK